jgi:uncharacterized protein YbcI
MINIPKGYKPQSEDTSLKIDIFQFQLWRKKNLIDKAELIIGVTQGCRQMTLMGIKNQHSDKTLAQQRHLYTQRILGQKISNQIKHIHLETNEKIDIFILGDKPLLQQEMQRKTLEKVTLNNDFLYLATPEDIILQKLIWYRQENRISDRQWRDVLGVLKTQTTKLDFTYLKYWSEKEKISDLLNQALLESGL